MLLPALAEPSLAATLIADAGYAAVTGTALMAAVAACAAIVLVIRKRITWDTWVDMPVGLSPQDAAAPDMGRTCELILGRPGLRYPDPWTAGAQQGWLVILGITNPGPATVRSGDFTAPLTFAFPGRQVQATQVLPESAGRLPGRAPAVRMPAQSSPDAGHADIRATRVQLTGQFLLRPGDSYSLLLILTGTPAGRSRIQQEGALAGGKIIPPPGGEPAIS
jgi:hypothetical protein